MNEKALSVGQVAERYGWTRGQIKWRRQRYWRRGVHFFRVGGETHYNGEMIDKWHATRLTYGNTKAAVKAFSDRKGRD
tara:strand:+ start:19257 stop:19490 length:234 start_codon:yes stop_codon:yes gene_type:complete